MTLASRAKAASRVLASAGGAERSRVLEIASGLVSERAPEILAANEVDLQRATAAGASRAALDRLALDEKRVAAMSAVLAHVAAMADPVGEVVEGWVRPNGLRVTKIRVPLGVIGVIYENRPNVTADVAALCLRSGNAALLRGSSSAVNSNVAITAAMTDALSKAGLPPAAVSLVEDTSRSGVVDFVRLEGLVDCLVPRGGPALVEIVRANATVPYVIDGDGNCHVYLDASADLEMATAIVVNSKTSRPGVCNAAESLLVHEAVAGQALPRLAAAMPGIELVGDAAARAILAEIGEATEEDFGREYLGPKMSVAVVSGVDEAVAHVNRYGTGHTEAIVAQDIGAIEAFVSGVDAAAVAVNASTRFTDGEQFGFGAEVGISTQKLHARGPMGARELTTTKYVVSGSGHIRC